MTTKPPQRPSSTPDRGSAATFESELPSHALISLMLLSLHAWPYQRDPLHQPSQWSSRSRAAPWCCGTTCIRRGYVLSINWFMRLFEPRYHCSESKSNITSGTAVNIITSYEVESAPLECALILLTDQKRIPEPPLLGSLQDSKTKLQVGSCLTHMMINI